MIKFYLREGIYKFELFAQCFRPKLTQCESDIP